MNIFITGATGFVGCYLRNCLRSPERRVWGSAYPDVPDSTSEDQIIGLDIRSEEEVFKCIQEIRPDWVFHLAAISNVRHSWNMRKETLETNIIGTHNVFEGIKKFSPNARVLFVSSSDVYGAGSSSGNPLTEKEKVVTMNPYAYSKWSAEILSEFYTRVENLDILIARPFPHTGPGQSTDFVCSDWAHQISRIERGLEDPIIKVGNVSIERDFTDVRDVVRAYVLLMQNGQKGEVYNVCSGRYYSLETLLEQLLSLTQSEISVRLDSQKLRKMDIPRLVGDNNKIKQAIPWQPQIPMEKTLQELLDYWRQRLS